MQSRMGRWSVAGALLVIWLGTAVAAQAQVLNFVPPDAWVVVRVGNVQDASTKISQLAQQWGLAAMVPAMNDPLGHLMTQSHMAAGVNKAGEAAFAMMPPGPDGGEPQVVALIPVSDYQAFLGNLQGAKTEGEVTEFTPPQEQQALYSVHWGDYAAVSPNRAVIAGAKPAGLKLQGLAAQEMQGKDIVVFANIQAMRPMALAGLQRARQQIQNQMAMAAGNQGAAGANPTTRQTLAPVGKAVVDQFFNVIQHVVEDAQAATYGVSLTPDGIRTTLAADFTPDSPSGKLIARVKNTADPLTVGLPTEKYMFITGMTGDPALGGEIVDSFTAPIVQALGATGETGKPIQDYIAAYRQILTASRGGAFGMLVPSGQLGQQGLFQFISVATGDSAAMAEGQRKLMALQDQFTQAMGAPAGQNKVTLTPGAKTIAGVTLDQIQMQFNMQPHNAQEMQAAQFINFFYGPNGWNVLSGAVDPEHYVSIAGGTDQQAADAIAAVKAGNNPVGDAAAYKTVAGKLPANRVMVAYVPVDNIVNAAANVARQFGMPMQLNLPADLPPVGMTLGTEGSSIRADSYIPSQLVQSLISSALQMRQQMQGGPGGPGAAPGGEPSEPGGL